VFGGASVGLGVTTVGKGVSPVGKGVSPEGVSVGFGVTTVGRGESPGDDGRAEGAGVGVPVGALEIVSVGCKVGEKVGGMVAPPVGLGLMVGSADSPAVQSVFSALTQSGVN
jgi:hypothetical protein